MIATHAITVNGEIHGELKNHDMPPADEIRRLISLMDGSHRYAFSLWRLPSGIPIDKVDFSRWPQEYIQAAGSRDRMALEVRKIESGNAKHYVVGRNMGPVEQVQRVNSVIDWNAHTAIVCENEVFDSERAGDLFVAYYSTDNIPTSYTVRILDL